jgi:hypothetical protein
MGLGLHGKGQGYILGEIRSNRKKHTCKCASPSLISAPMLGTKKARMRGCDSLILLLFEACSDIH